MLFGCGNKKLLWVLSALLIFSLNSRILAANEDLADGEVTDEGDAEPVEDDLLQHQQNVAKETSETTPDAENGASSDVQVNFLFTSKSPEPNTKELVASQLTKFLIGFSNRGEKDFVVKAIDTSFRYPMDFTYHIQNFSAVRYERVVQPKQEATFDYAFIPSDQFIGRPLGLVVNLHYMDADGAYYTHAVYNETINVVEDETAFSTETGFLYVVLAALGVLVLFLGQHYLTKLTRKPASSSSSYQPTAQEVGTNKNEVDYEWIPRTNFMEKKSPKSGHQSPRSRRPVKTN